MIAQSAEKRLPVRPFRDKAHMESPGSVSDRLSANSGVAWPAWGSSEWTMHPLTHGRPSPFVHSLYKYLADLNEA